MEFQSAETSDTPDLPRTPYFLIFNGMKEKNSIDNLVLFDREVKEAAQKALQKSVNNAFQR